MAAKTPTKDDLLTVVEVAELCGVTDRMTRYWIADGLLPAERVNRKWFIRRSDYEAALKRGHIGA